MFTFRFRSKDKENRTYTIEQAAQHLGVSRGVVQEWVMEGKLEMSGRRAPGGYPLLTARIVTLREQFLGR